MFFKNRLQLFLNNLKYSHNNADFYVQATGGLGFHALQNFAFNCRALITGMK